MREEADLIRVLFRDLDKFPNLVAEMREGIVNPLYDMIAKWLSDQPEMAGKDEDWDALSLALGGAIVNYWLASDALHQPPQRVDEERFINGWAASPWASWANPPRPSEARCLPNPVYRCGSEHGYLRGLVAGARRR